MIRSVYIEGENVRTDLPAEVVARVVASGEGLLWLDISEDGPAALDMLQDTLSFHPLAIEDCFDDRLSSAKADDYSDYLFLITQSAAYEASNAGLSIHDLGLFLGANYVVTVHRHPVQTVENLLDRAAEQPAYMQRGADFLAHSILDYLVDELRPVVEAMDERLDTLETLILEHPHHSQLNAVMQLKRNALRLRRVIVSQRDLVNRLSRGEYPQFIRPDTAIFYRDVYDHLVREESLLESVRELSDSALNYYLSATNNRMNEVMKALSVVAAIFLPLTLLASIFGTNLDYAPLGLTFEGGFYLMLAAMLVITGAMIAFFRYRHWF